jgi:hypothetical protein
MFLRHLRLLSCRMHGGNNIYCNNQPQLGWTPGCPQTTTSSGNYGQCASLSLTAYFHMLTFSFSSFGTISFITATTAERSLCATVRILHHNKAIKSPQVLNTMSHRNLVKSESTTFIVFTPVITIHQLYSACKCISGSGNNRDNGIRETYNIPLWSPMGVRDANICFVLETCHK